jgi:hypothetical protein
MTAYEAAQVVRALSGNGHGIKAISGTCCRFEAACSVSTLPAKTMIITTVTVCPPTTFFEGAVPNASLYEASKKRRTLESPSFDKSGVVAPRPVMAPRSSG